MSDDIEGYIKEFEDYPDDPVVRNPPPEIFLNVGPIEIDCDFSELEEVCWASEGIDDADIRYVLARHSLTADELFKDAELNGYVELSRREGPPNPEEASRMGGHEIDICMARQSEEGWSEFADKAVATVRRLEDLRRWRPMSEPPADDRRVLARILGSFIGQSMHFSQGRWLLSGSTMPDRALLDYEWTYIPGQEPAE